MAPTTSQRLTKQTIASEQKRINGQTFSINMIRTPKPPPSSSLSVRSATPLNFRSTTRSRITGIVPGVQEIRLFKLQQVAYSLQSEEDLLMKAIKETIVASGLERAEGLSRLDYEAVERRLELYILVRGGNLPERE